MVTIKIRLLNTRLARSIDVNVKMVLELQVEIVKLTTISIVNPVIKVITCILTSITIQLYVIKTSAPVKTVKLLLLIPGPIAVNIMVIIASLVPKVIFLMIWKMADTFAL